MPLYSITHPMADEISVQDGPYHYCSTGISSEIAFFQNEKWVCVPIEPFADYADAPAGDTMVYGHVPNTLISAFLDESRAVPISRWE